VRRSLAKLLRLPLEYIPLMSATGLRSRLGRTVRLSSAMVANDARQIDYIPPGFGHLRVPSQFMLCPSVYSPSFAGSALGWAAGTVDARGFDAILVDTPTYLRFEKSAGAEVIAVIRDLIPLSDPSFDLRWRKVFASKIALTIEGADSLVFVSEHTRRRCLELFPHAVERRDSTILHPSVDGRIADGGVEPNGAQPTREYLVAIVSDEARKNIDGLTSAFWHLPAHIGLKVIGHLGAHRFQAARGGAQAAANRPPQVELLGYVSDAEKRRLLAGALGVIVPSFAEGFGIPIIEGIAFGKPVFCSDIEVFRDVAGDDGFYFDPYAPESIAGAVAHYLDNRAAFDGRIATARDRCLRRFGLASLVGAVGRRCGNALGAIAD
jgi:glycosyltransferase involved in cell wall biosynthesis